MRQQTCRAHSRDRQRRWGRNVDNLVERTARIIRAQLGILATEPLSREADIRDLGADSLDGVEILLALEEEFECAIPDAVAEKMRTLGDVVDFLENGVSEVPLVALTVEPGSHPIAQT